MEANYSTKQEQQLSLQGHTQSQKGGTYCCVPFCDSNTKVNPGLSFHKFPNESKLRKTWLHWIDGVDFKPNQYHRVCSNHFRGGKRHRVTIYQLLAPYSFSQLKAKHDPHLSAGKEMLVKLHLSGNAEVS